MFPGSPRVQENAKVIPIGAVAQIALAGDDPDFIVLEVFNTLFSGSTITLPNSARIGKKFRFALVTDPFTNPAITSQFIDIVVPLYKASGALNIWRLFSGQRPVFVYGPTGWIADGGVNLSSVGANNIHDLASGSGANGSDRGAAFGYNADGSSSGFAAGGGALAFSFGVATGRFASGHTGGAAAGYAAVGHTNGAAMGNSANGSSSGAAFGSGAIANANGASFGYFGSTNAKDMAVTLGYYSKAERYREMVKSADGAATTLRSWSMVNWFGDTTNATATELLLGGTAAQRCVLLNNSAFMFTMQIIAAVTAAGNTSSWTITGAIKRGATAASTVLVGTPTITMTGQDGGAAAWVVAVTADTTNGALVLTVTGAAATTVRWNAAATLSEARF